MDVQWKVVALTVELIAELEHELLAVSVVELVAVLDAALVCFPYQLM